ncbi:3'-5' exonuclease [Paracoccus sp. MBLB3053]|uniref:DNA-directed DNA polymerase n=1 Tax=Paracoccus aurantius TaxID=3073814 RepID=A0ABU2HTS7_9RHOB|nr:3'-5' exonuclease [Paracoccus sp. MBLB3053]MDS9467994.1 3'-5' exonuclease [Paracoccus sp. MBLB3053]
MLKHLSLRLRVLLIFAALLAGLLLVLAAGLVLAWERLSAAGVSFLGEAAPGASSALIGAGAVGFFGILGLVVWVWYLFDQHVARPIETLAGGLRTGAIPAETEGHYLADLAPAVRDAAEARTRSAEALSDAIEAQLAETAREKAMLEAVLGDIGAVAIMTDCDGRVVFFNAAGRATLPGLVLGRPIARLLRPAALTAAERRLAVTQSGATELSVVTSDGARLTGTLRVAPEGRVLILRASGQQKRARAIERLRRHAATLVPMLDAVGGEEVPAPVREAIRAEGSALIDVLREMEPDSAPSQVDAQAFAASVEGVAMGRIDALCLETEPGGLAALFSHLAHKLHDLGLAPLLFVVAEGEEALVTLEWRGRPLGMAELDAWMAEPPDPDRPGVTGSALAQELGSGLWSEPAAGGGRIIMPVAASATRCEIAPGLTYRTALGNGEILSEMTFVVFDTETTGLLPSDRICQIAGLRIMAGRLTGERYETLVNPGRPIPASATAIHGIDDAMVATAPGLAETLAAFRHFSEDAVLVAHNAPFDMGLLRAARDETGIEFPNRVLDTVLLSAMLWGQSAPHTLDALAARLGVEIAPELRHTAMGDAEATARILLRMIPALEAKGLTKLDQISAEARKHRRLIEDADRA